MLGGGGALLIKEGPTLSSQTIEASQAATKTPDPVNLTSRRKQRAGG